MQCRHDLSKVTASSDVITVWDSKRIFAHRGNPMHNVLTELINNMGEGSRRSQGLSQVLTSVTKLQTTPDHRLYMLSQGRCCVGILKVGVKKLFVRTETAVMHEIEPMCVLDFYVHEAAQRSGFGKILYEYMLVSENILPHQLAYDRPSPKFLNFLSKYYKLSQFVPQSNNFVVFGAYFDPRYKGCFGADRRLSDVPVLAPAPRAAPSPPPQPHGPPPPPLKSSLLSRTVPSTTALVPGSNPRREVSPTRSGSNYNIITLKDDVGAVPAAAPNSLCEPWATTAPIYRSSGTDAAAMFPLHNSRSRRRTDSK